MKRSRRERHLYLRVQRRISCRQRVLRDRFEDIFQHGFSQTRDIVQVTNATSGSSIQNSAR